MIPYLHYEHINFQQYHCMRGDLIENDETHYLEYYSNTTSQKQIKLQVLIAAKVLITSKKTILAAVPLQLRIVAFFLTHRKYLHYHFGLNCQSIGCFPGRDASQYCRHTDLVKTYSHYHCLATSGKTQNC